MQSRSGWNQNGNSWGSHPNFQIPMNPTQPVAPWPTKNLCSQTELLPKGWALKPNLAKQKAEIFMNCSTSSAWVDPPCTDWRTKAAPREMSELSHRSIWSWHWQFKHSILKKMWFFMNFFGAAVQFHEHTNFAHDVFFQNDFSIFHYKHVRVTKVRGSTQSCEEIMGLECFAQWQLNQFCFPTSWSTIFVSVRFQSHSCSQVRTWNWKLENMKHI